MKYFLAGCWGLGFVVWVGGASIHLLIGNFGLGGLYFLAAALYGVTACLYWRKK